ncbi:MAG: GFA family protein [Novosphingobium sp.]|nr:GFA family protein [Novosphingobium sp.]
MAAPYTGRCLCGRVTATISGEPVAIRQCWCRQCQQIASGSPTNNAIFKSKDVDLKGELGESAWKAASGNTLALRYCPSCGTQIYAQSSERPYLHVVRMGFLDEGHGLRPAMTIWTSEAPDWAAFHPSMEQCAGQPGSTAPAR